jgi:fermentation-respiration switch protein FrsA (DUF1100 family)
MDDAIDRGGLHAGFNPDEADAALAIRTTGAHVLLLHGTWDYVVPHSNSERIHAAAPEKSRLKLLHGLGHVSIWIDPFGDVKSQTRAWFDHYLAYGINMSSGMSPATDRNPPSAIASPSFDTVRK